MQKLKIGSQQKVSINTLGITENDLKEFKKFIDKEEERIKNSGIDRFDFV